MAVLGAARDSLTRNATLILTAMLILLAGPSTSAVAQSCQPRPPVRVVTVVAGLGRLQVTVTAGAGTLRSLSFTGGQSASVEIDGSTLRPPFTRSLSGEVAQISFGVVRDGGAGTPATLPFIVTDGCGAWPTFVGGG